MLLLGGWGQSESLRNLYVPDMLRREFPNRVLPFDVQHTESRFEQTSRSRQNRFFWNGVATFLLRRGES